MRLLSWLGGPAPGPSRRAKPGRPRRSPAGYPLSVEHLEDRDVPAFAPPVGYDAGASPQAVVSGYFNSDGFLDLAVANSGDNSVSVLLGNGDGTFQAARNSSTIDPVLGTGSGPHSLAVGDLNGDEVLDVATANANDVSVLLGHGDGTFGAASGYTVPYSPTSVAVGDLTGDGRLDLGVMSSYSGYVAYANVLVGTGGGTFTGPNSTYLGYGNYRSATAINLDGVGADELVAANTYYGYYYGAVAVFAADGFGSLQFSDVLYTGGDALSVAVGDVNDDGSFDIVTADYYSYYSSYSLDRVSVLLGTGGGGFGSAQPYAVGSFPVAVALGDFTGDGKVDIATANYYSSDVSVLYGSGGGAFSAPTSFAAGSFPYSLAAGHFDADNRLDAATANTGSGDLSVLLNDGDWPGPPPPTVSVGDAAVVEGNGGTGSPTTATFTVYLSALSLADVTVHYATADVSAAAGSDYAFTSGDVTIPAGQYSWTFTVPVTGDRVGEDTEYFAVNLSAPAHATIGDGQGLGTIYDDEPRVSVNNVTVTEGNTGSVNATFTVTLSAVSDVDMTVHYASATDTAGAGDFTAASGDVAIPHGQLSRTFAVAVTGDRIAEPTERFVVNLSAPVNAGVGNGQGFGTIIDNEPRLSINNVAKKEGNGGTVQFVFTVSLSAAYDQAVTVNFATANGTATAGSDYQAKNGTLTFAAGVTSMTITVNVLPDKSPEPDETFFVNLSGASGNAFISGAQGVGTILDDDLPPGKKK